MQKSKHIVIIAGEESGDLHAAALIKQLKAIHPDLIISGIGGQHMKNAGAELISDLARYGVTGLTEILRYLKILRNAFQAIKMHLKTQKPDLLILVDYPGFNLRLAKYAKQELGLKIIYYISPQIWAWKANRIHLIKQCVDKMAVILPFEKNIYEKAGVPVQFVGHPLVEKLAHTKDTLTCRAELNLNPDARIIALLPGSRTNEIERHMPVLRDTALKIHQTLPDIKFIIPVAGTIKSEQISSYFESHHQIPVTLIAGKAIECMSAADFVIVASGTASLECALLEKPMCIIYKSSLLTYYAAMKLIKVRFLGLCNLLTDQMTVPEFLQYDCNAFELSQYIFNFYSDTTQPNKMISQLNQLKLSLSSNKADCTLSELIATELSEINA
ncbi:MAG: lipid-A-disaccharide synthase [Legionella sp.]|nr:lipid-A-disaccharide synthase [Legionella sp.]